MWQKIKIIYKWNIGDFLWLVMRFETECVSHITYRLYIKLFTFKVQVLKYQHENITTAFFEFLCEQNTVFAYTRIIHLADFLSERRKKNFLFEIDYKKWKEYYHKNS